MRNKLYIFEIVVVSLFLIYSKGLNFVININVDIKKFSFNGWVLLFKNYLNKYGKLFIK